LTLGQASEAARGYNLFAVTLLTCFHKKRGKRKKVKREIKEVLFVDG